MIELRLLALSITFRRLIFQWCWHRLPAVRLTSIRMMVQRTLLT